MTDPEITQADREAAATLSPTLAHAANVQLGNLDDSEGVIAIARHRMEAEQRGRAEGAAQERAEIVALIEASSGCHGFHTDNALYLIKLIEFDEYKRIE